MKSEFRYLNRLPCLPLRWAGLALSGAVFALGGCGLPAQQSETPPRLLELDGVAYRVEQITASTWTARAPARTPGGSQATANLVRAIEKASNCKVTDSSLAAKSDALSAQVDCGSKLKD